MTPSLRARLEEKIQAKHLLGHSFYQRWQAGELTLPELQGYAKEYYRFEREFPRFLSALHTQCSDLPTRQSLLENLVEEERGENNHPELWLRFAEGVGVPREAVQDHFHSDETEHLVRVMRESCQVGMIQGLAALYAYERQQPDVARQKADGLQRFYGVKDRATTEFFRVHQTVDVYHSETEMALLSQACRDEADEEKAIGAAQAVLDALYDFLDGVERRYGRRAQSGDARCAKATTWPATSGEDEQEDLDESPRASWPEDDASGAYSPL